MNRPVLMASVDFDVPAPVLNPFARFMQRDGETLDDYHARLFRQSNLKRCELSADAAAVYLGVVEARA